MISDFWGKAFISHKKHEKDFCEPVILIYVKQ